MKFARTPLLCLALFGAAPALADTPPVQLTPDYVEGFLKDAGLQLCAIETLDPKASLWKDAVASYWVEVASDCAATNRDNPDIARIMQFSSASARNSVVQHYRTNAPRGINLRAAVWPVGEYTAVGLIGPNTGRYRQALQRVYEQRAAARKAQ